MRSEGVGRGAAAGARGLDGSALELIPASMNELTCGLRVNSALAVCNF